MKEVERLIEELDEEYTKELQMLRQELESNKESSYNEFVRGFTVAAAMFRLFKRKVEARQKEDYDASKSSAASVASTLAVSEYQRLAKRTMKPRRTLAEDLSDYTMGLCGEAGELANKVKKMLYHGHSVDELIPEIVEECGDVSWYQAAILERLGIDMERALEANIEKLRVRYPEGYSDERSRHRTPTSGVVPQKGQLGNSDSGGDSNSVGDSDSMEELLGRIEQRGYTWRLFSPPFGSYDYIHNRDKYPDIGKYQLIVWDNEYRHHEFYGDTLREAIEKAVEALCS